LSGCLEVLAWLLMADRCVAPVSEYAGGVLFLETSEEMPAATEVYRILRCMGERDLLGRFGAVLLGRAKAWSFDHPAAPSERDTYQADQRAAVLSALAQYAPQAMAVFDVDLGHTDPQLVIPYGGMVRVDGPARRITVTYLSAARGTAVAARAPAPADLPALPYCAAMRSARRVSMPH